MSYPNLGGRAVIPAADLLDLRSNANRAGFGNTRVGESPRLLGKRAGLMAWRDSGSGYSLVFALGDKSSDGWREADGSATRLPTNLSTWTVGADSTYSSGLLTTDGGNDAAGRAGQSMTLTAGKYRIRGTAAAEGSTTYAAPRIRIGTSAAGTQIADKVVGVTTKHPTAAENADPKEAFDFEFTVASTGTVHFTLDVVDQTGAIAAGSAFISLLPLEAA